MKKIIPCLMYYLATIFALTQVSTAQPIDMTAPDYFVSAYHNTLRNNNKAAIADYNKAIMLNPLYYEAYNNRGILKANELNDLRGALDDYNQAITLNPNYAEAYFNRGLLKTDQNNKTGAIKDLTRASQLFRQQGRVQGIQDCEEQIRKLENI